MRGYECQRSLRSYGKTQVHELPIESKAFQKDLDAYDGALGELWFTDVLGAIRYDAIEQSDYLADEPKVNQRRLQVRWSIAHQVQLDRLRFNCPNGYGKFATHLVEVATVTVQHLH